MIAMTLAEIAAVVGGRLHDAEEAHAGGAHDRDAHLVTAPVVIDSREVEPGCLFAAFVGEQADGHDYAAAALAAGAAGALASRPVGAPSVVVPDVRVALADLARHVLGRLPQVRVVALTGSQGKTSTKDLLAAVLAESAPTVATFGSFNNELGLPLTVLRAAPETRFLVLEMGARGIGHIRDLCAVARPDVAVVLNVGKAHLGEFGTQRDIATAKGEIVEALDRDGVAVLNADDPLVAAMAARTVGRVLTVGRAASADVRIGEVVVDGGGRPGFALHHGQETAEVHLRLVGEHQALNAAAAAAAALALGLRLDAAAPALSRVATLSRWRMEVADRDDGVTVVNDSYNANPDSMAAALGALVALAGDPSRTGGRRRTLAVLGEMRELGEDSRAEHEAVGDLAARLGVDWIVAVGEPAAGIVAGAAAQRRNDDGHRGEIVSLEDTNTATAWLEQHLRPGDVVLLKASRGARLDRVADALLSQPATRASGGAR